MEKQLSPTKTEQAARMLAAIGHPTRLQIFRSLVQAGPQGMAAGEVARALEMAPSSLNFHLRTLQSNHLIESRTEGRFVIYAARFDAMAGLLEFLTQDCCGGNPCLRTMSSDQVRRCTTQMP